MDSPYEGFEQIATAALLKPGDPDTLVMFFSSRLAPVLHPFDGMNFSRRERHTFLLLRDETGHLYYHGGIAGLGDSILETAAALDEICAHLRPDRLVMLGSSMGGYAALLFGHLLGADAVIAINGLSYVDPEVAEFWGGGERGPGSIADIAALYAARGEFPAFTDLRRVVEESAPPHPVTRWHFSPRNTVDTLHAAHVSGLPSVDFVPHRPVRQHARLASALIRSGVLTRELEGQWQGGRLGGGPRRPAADLDQPPRMWGRSPGQAAWEWSR